MMTENPSDEILLRRFVAGERDALGDLAGRYETALLGLARGLLGGRADAACDAVQEAWVRVIRHAAAFRGRSSVKTWLYRIVINRCHDSRLRRLRDKRATPDDPPAAREPAAGAGVSRAERVDGDETLRRAVAALGEDQRTVVILCYHAGMTHEQAAEILEIPIGTLKSRLHAALSTLRERLSAEASS